MEHQYWDLSAHETEFEVTLKFGGIPKYLKVPYLAITRFHDPSVGFALQFDPEQPETENSDSIAQIAPAPKKAEPKRALGRPAKKSVIKKKKAKTSEKDEENAPENDSEKVVSLDSFRKK